jgi:hypothetical protein
MNRARSGSFDGGRRGSSSGLHPPRSRSLDRGRGHRYGSILERRASFEECDDAEREPLVLDDSTSWKLRPAAAFTAPCNLFMKDKELLKNEMAGMTNLAVPTIITSFLEMLPGIVTIILVGRAEYDSDVGDVVDEEITTYMKQLHLDAAALAVMIMNVVALSPAFGKCK